MTRLAEWNRSTIAEEWLKHTGTFGDYLRLSLIHPAIWHAAERIKAGDNKIGESSLYQALCSWQSPSQASDRASLEERTRAFIDKNSKLLEGVSVLDLGCGGGQLGKVLKGLGARYRGADGASALFGTAADLDIVTADLSRPEALDRVFDGLPANEPLLATCVVSLDHIANPLPLLERLSLELARRPENKAALLTVTLNPYWRLQPDGVPTAHQRHGSAWQVEKSNETFRPGGPGLSVSLRPLEWYETCFRDAGFLLLRAEPLLLSPEQVSASRRELDGPRRLPVVWASLLAPRIQPIVSSPAIASRQQRTLAQELVSISNAVRLYDVPARSTVFRRANLGGQLIAVLDGSIDIVDSWADSDGETAVMMTFEAGQVIGEVESPDTVSGTPSRFPETGRAGSQGCVVGVVSADDTIRVLNGSGFGDRLLGQVRDRFSLANQRRTDRYDKKWANDILGDSADFSKVQLCAQALCMWMLLEQRYRRSGLPVVYAPPEALTAFSLKLKTIGNTVRLLHHLQIIDAIPVGYIDNAIKNDLWIKALVALARRVGTNISDSEFEAACRNRLPEAPKQGPKSTKPILRAIDGFDPCVVTTSGQPTKCMSAEQLKHWQSGARRVCHLMGDQQPSLFVLHDECLLTILARADQKTMVRELTERSQHLGVKGIPMFAVLENQMDTPAKVTYLNFFLSLICRSPSSLDGHPLLYSTELPSRVARTALPAR